MSQVLKEKATLQNAMQILEHQSLCQGSHINQVLEDWRINDEN